MPKEKTRTQEAQDAVEEKGPLIPTYYKRGEIPASFKEILKNIDKAVQSDLKTLKDSEELEAIKSLFPDAGQWLEANESRGLYASLVLFTIYDAAELIKSVYLDKQKGKASLFDFADMSKGPSKLSEFFNHIEEKDGKLIYTISIDGHRPKAVYYPVDKLNANIWGFNKEPDNGKFDITILTGPKGGTPGKREKSNKPATVPAVAYSIDFSTVEADFPIVKRLTSFDKRVLCSVGAIMDAGQSIMSIDEIYYTMGNTGKPNETQKKKINQSLTKMTARAHIDNDAEIKAGMKYKRFKYDGDFLAFERIEGVKINGKGIDAAIHVFKYPIALQFAKMRKQVQAVPMPVLQSDKRKTESNLAIEDYLIQRISETRKNRQPGKILFDTMYKRLKIEGKTERQRMRSTAADYMEHYQKTGWIDSYTVEKDGLSFSLSTEDKIDQDSAQNIDKKDQ